jgi:2-amino-4-hydroxy-6-hydroxymethyldihydropteridine diphosphokinase
MTKYAVALGSNQGDRLGHLRSALDEVGPLGDFYVVSGLYETAPVGGPEQDPYLNAVVVIESPLQSIDLLQRLQSVEAGHHRERSVRWGPRTLDLDIIAMDPGSVNADVLQIPHPRAAERRFVLEPLCDVWPDALVGEGLTAAEALKRVGEQEVALLASDWVIEGQGSGRYWVGAQFALFLAIAVALIYGGSLPDSGLSGRVIAGGLMVFVGGSIAVASARSLGGAFTALPEPVTGADLIETGLYAYVRHPIYGAVLLILFGASLALASPLAGLLSCGLGILLWLKSGYEERQLRIVYPKYSAYRRRVTKRFIPFLV